MGRSKVPMERINNDKKRNLTFKTRKHGIIKKALELTTLCDVNVSMIICTDHQESEIFSSDSHKVTSMMDLYRLNRVMKPEKIRYSSLSDFVKENTMKVEEELAKEKKNLEAKNIKDYTEVQRRELALGLESEIDKVKEKIESLKKISNIQNKDHCRIRPTNPESSSSMPSLNPCPYAWDDDELGFDPTELFGDQNNNCDRHENLSLQPPASAHYFSPEILPQPEPAPFSDQNNLIMLSSNPDSVLKLPMSKDYNYCYNHVNSILQPTPPGYCFSPEILQQPELPTFNGHNNNFIMQYSNPDSMMKLQMSENLQPPPPAYCFGPEIPQHPALPPFSDQNNFIMQSSNPGSIMKLQMSKDDIECCFQPREVLQHLELPRFSIQNNMILQSSKPDSMMNTMMSEDDKDYCDHENVSLQFQQ
ncbi:hypothetical protein L2E82_22435 [Cichorium intybus]|uniref:Uncharacterized protein n=1 Tax=Cichorium intybus TaxID=13427 RepID=A0ACB9DXR2_CICIN|nr:hypothetical protein L2E82_22435 [Cichorium intybus]